jgi:serine/threonine protein kinase
LSPWSWEVDGSELSRGDLLCDQGVHGNVFRAKWQEREVAVKVLRHDRNPPRLLVKTFREEFETIASVRHPYVVGMLGACTVPRSFFIATLDYMPNWSIFDALHNDRLNFSSKGRVRMALDTARGMCHLHSLGTCTNQTITTHTHDTTRTRHAHIHYTRH